MKISKQLVLITLMLFMFIASGCSKNLFDFGSGGGPSTLNESGDEYGIGAWDPQTGSGGDASSGLYEKPDSAQDFGTTKQAMPGNGAAGSFRGETLAKKNGPELSSSLDGGTSSSLYEKPGPGPDFGSAPQGMPGDGSTGSFNAKPFDGDREGNGLQSAEGEAPKPGSEFFKEESVGEFDTASRLYEKPGPGPDFGSAAQGMPGDGSTGSFSAEPYVEEGGMGNTSESPEPFLPDKKDNLTVPLPVDEEVRRRLPYRPTDHLEDIHFAFDKFDLDGKSRAILNKNVAYLESHPNLKIEVQGHCDERGSNNYNITLGERRARSTKAYLIAQGVDENRIRTISYGEERPFCFENNEKCWQLNRRGHFLVAE